MMCNTESMDGKPNSDVNQANFKEGFYIDYRQFDKVGFTFTISGSMTNCIE